VTKITLVAAMDEARAIGRGGALPWRLPADLRRFKAITMGKPLIMGRLTWESIGRPLPGRPHFILTRSPDYRAPGCTVAHSLQEALEAARRLDGGEVIIAGGQQVYRQALPLATDIRLTLVHTRAQGADTWFPAFSQEDWRLVHEERRSADDRNAFDMTFQDWARR
jgi:dihydrofolate reductase